MLKRLLSYIVPVNIHKRNSGISKSLEVSWNNGQLVLDSLNTNYSYGSLQRVLRHGLKSVGFDKVRKLDHILILGVAGGSVIRTLIDEVKYKGKITGVEIDKEVIDIANRFFALDSNPNLTIVIDDAFEFVLKTKSKYGLIIIDIFQDTFMPNFQFESFFSNRIGFLLNPGGYVLFNTMVLSGNDALRNQDFIDHIDRQKYELIKIPRPETHNELIAFRKLP